MASSSFLKGELKNQLGFLRFKNHIEHQFSLYFSYELLIVFLETFTKPETNFNNSQLSIHLKGKHLFVNIGNLREILHKVFFKLLLLANTVLLPEHLYSFLFCFVFFFFKETS